MPKVTEGVAVVARTGRPPKPIELHRKAGTYRPARHASTTTAAEVAPIDPGTPALTGTPADALAAVLADGVSWLARTDAVALALLRSMLEERQPLTEQAAAGSTEARRALRALDAQVIALLAALGFDPASRGRLGLAEVKARGKLEELRERQARR